MKYRDYVPLQYPGSVTRGKLDRLKLIYIFMLIVGLGLAVTSQNNGLKAFGLGLMFPGGGFLQYLQADLSSVLIFTGLTLLSAVLFAVGMVLWFWNGNIVAPILVWCVAALTAGMMPGYFSVTSGFSAAPAVVLMLVSVVCLIMYSKISAGRKMRSNRLLQRIDDINKYDLAKPVAERNNEQVKELSEEDLHALRFAYDRALQPIEEWNGFHFGDQWQPAATRYQVNTLGWALALANHNAMPSMRGYLQQSQLNLIEKKKNHRLWSYWRWENSWGNLRNNPDPMPIDNIMYSGYYGMQIGMYQAATGDLCHDEVGSIELKHPSGEKFIYDFPQMIDILDHQFRNEFCLWACEPNMIYPFCNATGAIALAAYDLRHGTEYWKSLLPDFRKQLKEEFTYPDGSIISLKSKRTGLNLDLGSITTSLVSAAYFSPLIPDLAEFQWAMSKSDLFDLSQNQLMLKDIKSLTAPDPGNYKMTYAYNLSNLLMAAAEMGDEEVVDLCQQLINEHLPAVTEGGVSHHPDVSVWAHAQFLMGRVGMAHGFRDLITKGTPSECLRGPLITSIDYPEVLVAKAVSDGVALDMVFYPGESAGEKLIEVSQLRPTQQYTIESNHQKMSLLSDSSGVLNIPIIVEGRTQAKLYPA